MLAFELRTSMVHAMVERLFIALGIFLLSFSSAFADRFYVGSDVVVTNLEDSEGSLSFRDRPAGARLLAGISFNEFVGIEGSYVDTGEADDTVPSLGTVTAEMSGYVVSLVLQAEDVIPKLFTKFGYHNSDVDITGNGQSTSSNEDGFAAAIGFRHDIFYDNLSIRGEVDFVESDIFENLWSIGIGLELSFGD